MFANLADQLWGVVSQEPLSFFIGAFFGFVAANRWKLSRRGEKEDKPDDATTT